MRRRAGAAPAAMLLRAVADAIGGLLVQASELVYLQMARFRRIPQVEDTATGSPRGPKWRTIFKTALRVVTL